MKAMMRKTLSGFLALVITISLLPAPAHAYVGAMTQNVGGVTAAQQDGYYYLTNDYIGFYIRPDGNLTTVPSQKTLNDVKSIGATESHVFYKQTGPEIWNTDWNSAVGAGSSSVTIDQTDPTNPKLRQTLAVPTYNSSLTVTYELVQLDRGKTTDTTGAIIGEDDSDDGRTWGVLASASASFPDPLRTRLLWVTGHKNFGGVGHNFLGTVRLDRYTTTYAIEYPYNSTTTYYSATISSGLNRSDAEGISEAYTDSFSYANQFVAMQGYMNAMSLSGEGGHPTLISGIRGHWNNYASSVSYSPWYNSLLSVEHEFSSGWDAHALWGFRDLYATGESSNIPADPVSIPTEAACVGIVNDNGTLAAYAAKNEAALKSSYGSRLVSVFRGKFNQESGSFVFTNGAAQLSPSLTATWTEGSGGLSVAANGTVTARNVHLSAPTFKLYKPKNSNDTSLGFSFSEGKLSVGITPDNNDAILHIDIPGTTCNVEGVTADLSGALVFRGDMSISTPAIDAANITMTRLGMGWSNNRFTLAGVEASGAVDMQQLLGLDVGSASAEINSFPGEERYAFELELNVFDMFEAEGELELKRINNGALIPNTLEFKGAAETGVPLVPPVVVAEFNGLGGGFKNLADTINGDFFAIPPLRLTVSAKGSVLEIIEGWYTILVGPGYYKAALTDGKLLDMDIIDEYSWYTELSGDIRGYGGTSYKGLKIGGGMKIDLSITSDMPFIKAGGEFNASAFSGLDNYASPTRAYLMLGADGKIYGLVQIPAEAWVLNKDLKLVGAELAFALGGQTTVSVNSASPEAAVKDAFGNMSGYGGVAYTGNLIGFPFRIYYIFQDKHVGIKVGNWLGELDPFEPSPYGFSKLSLLDADTGKQVGIMVMNDNLTLLNSTRTTGADTSTLSFLNDNAADNGVSIAQSVYENDPGKQVDISVVTNAAADNGVTITQSVYGQSYEVVIADNAPDTDSLPFSLMPAESWEETTKSFMNSLTVQKSGEGSPLDLVEAIFGADGNIANSSTANVIVGDDCLTLKLPSKGTWTISSNATVFDISCYYASPYASFTGMSLTGAALIGAVADMDSGTNYVLRTYLGIKQGGTDYLLSQSDVSSGGAINETLSLSGSVAPTGSYYVTTILLEEITDDFNGDGADESAYVTTDTYPFGTTVGYTNSEQPDPPADVTLTAVGSELMRVQWKVPAGGNSPDGYYIRLYQQEGNNWSETGANYLLKTADLTPDADGYYTYDMAVTVGDKNLHLEAENTYKAGMTAFRYLADEDDDGTNDSLPVESGEAQSAGQYLPEATYPVLSYSPAPSAYGDTMKLLCINGATQIIVTSDEAADIAVTRMDTDAAVARTSDPGTTLAFDTPADFNGALNLKITATDADRDITVDYIGLRFDDTAPLITMDSDSFEADRNTGAFTATGVTESGATVSVADIISDGGTSGAQIDADEVTAGEDGTFAITGKLNPADTDKGLIAADSATVLLSASDAAGNVSATTFARIVAEAPTDKVLVSITPPTAITGVANGTEKTAAALGLPSAVTLATDDGNVSADAAWDVESCSYDPSDTDEQTFTVEGTVTLPTGVVNPNNVPLSISIEVTVNEATPAGTPPEISTDSLPNGTVGQPYTATLSAASATAVAWTVYGSDDLPDGLALDPITGTISGTPETAGTYTFTIQATNSMGSVTRDFSIKITAESGGGGRGSSTTYYTVSAILGAHGTITLSATRVSKGGSVIVSITPDEGYVVSEVLVNGYPVGAVTIYTIEDITADARIKAVFKPVEEEEAWENPFSDVDINAWYYDAVAFVNSRGLFNGTSEHTFSPDTGMTRGMLVAVLLRLSGEDGSGYQNSFSDVVPDSWYKDAAAWAAANGIVSGMGGNRFAPDEGLTREQLAMMLYNYARYKELDVTTEGDAFDNFKDKDDVSGWAGDAMEWVVARGIISGRPSGSLDPNGFATRAEVAAMLMRFIGNKTE